MEDGTRLNIHVYGIHRNQKWSPPSLKRLGSLKSSQFYQLMNEMLDRAAFLFAFLTELDELKRDIEKYSDSERFSGERNKALEVSGVWHDPS